MGNDSKSKNSFLEGGTMRHPVNTEIIESLFEEQVTAVQKRFPLLHINKVEIIAAKRAMRLFWEMAQ